jgi:hypothetical protein
MHRICNLDQILTLVTSESPPFQLATKDPVRDSKRDITPEENPTAISVSAAFTAITFKVPYEYIESICPRFGHLQRDPFSKGTQNTDMQKPHTPEFPLLDFHVCKSE